MKRKILNNILIIVIMIGMLCVLTGCGNGNEIIDNLNNEVQEEIAEWQEQGYARTLTMAFLQGGLDSNYVIVASGDSEFTSAPDITEYQENDVPNYEGNSYSQTRMMEETYTVNYLVVLDNSTGKYYNIEINYEETDLNGIQKQYPVFSNAKEIK